MPPSSAPEAPTLPLSSASSVAVRRILYADDVQELRDLMTMALSRDGYAVECVPDGAMAFDRLHEDDAQFDLLITDHHTPQRSR